MSFMSNSSRYLYSTLIRIKPEIAVRLAKAYWNEYFDKELLKDYTTIHWCTRFQLSSVLRMDRKTELCTQAYNSPPYRCGFIGGIGLVVEGNIVLAGSGDLKSDKWVYGHERFTSELDLLLDNNFSDIYEAIVKDWKPKAIVVDIDSVFSGVERESRELSTLLKEPYSLAKHGLPLLDVNGKMIRES